jgi:hypothetical protein
MVSTAHRSVRPAIKRPPHVTDLFHLHDNAVHVCFDDTTGYLMRNISVVIQHARKGAWSGLCCIFQADNINPL